MNNINQDTSELWGTSVKFFKYSKTYSFEKADNNYFILIVFKIIIVFIKNQLQSSESLRILLVIILFLTLKKTVYSQITQNLRYMSINNVYRSCFDPFYCFQYNSHG